MPAAQQRRVFSRVGAASNGTGGAQLDLTAIQAALAKRGGKKSFSAFDFSAFSTSEFAEDAASHEKEHGEDEAAALPAEPAVASHAAISHASTQVAVRTQLVTLMTKEVGTEARAALTEAKSQAASISAAASA